MELAVNGKLYQVLRLLGKGKGGYSYLVTDGAGEYVIKQIHHEPCDYYTFGNKMEAEIFCYNKLSSLGVVMPKMLAYDLNQELILKEYIEGDTIFDYVLRKEMKQDFVDQVKAMCERLYPANTNIDYFPTNFVVHDGKLYYVDYECNDYMAQWNYENWGSQYWWKSPAFLERFQK